MSFPDILFVSIPFIIGLLVLFGSIRSIWKAYKNNAEPTWKLQIISLFGPPLGLVFIACAVIAFIITAATQPLVFTPQRSSHIWNTEGSVRSLTYSPNGHILASVETVLSDSKPAQYVVRLRQIPTGEILHTLGGQAEVIYTLAFSHNGQMIATGDQGSRVQLWRVNDGALLATMSGHMEPVQQVVFGPDDTTLFSVSDDSTIGEWSIPDGKSKATIPWTVYYTCGIAQVGFVGHEAVFAVREGTDIVLRSVHNREILQTFHGFEGRGCADFEKVELRFDTRADLLASVDTLTRRKTTIRVWNRHTGTISATVNGHTDFIQSLTFSPDSQFLASASGIPYYPIHTTGDLSIRVWRITDGTPVAIFDNAHYGAIVGLAFSPDNHTLASGGVDGVIQFWEISP